MARYKGIIENLKHLIITDPHYDNNVWCRYENKFTKPTNWEIEFVIKEKEYKETYKGHELTIQGTAFNIILRDSSNKVSTLFNVIDEDNVEMFYGALEKKTDIGIDTASITLGTNKIADIIEKYCEGDKYIEDLSNNYPELIINTGADGYFGEVKEYLFKGEILCAIGINGWLDIDTEYDENKLLKYLERNFQIKKLIKVNENDLEL